MQATMTYVTLVLHVGPIESYRLMCFNWFSELYDPGSYVRFNLWHSMVGHFGRDVLRLWDIPGDLLFSILC